MKKIIHIQFESPKELEAAAWLHDSGYLRSLDRRGRGWYYFASVPLEDPRLHSLYDQLVREGRSPTQNTSGDLLSQFVWMHGSRWEEADFDDAEYLAVNSFGGKSLGGKRDSSDGILKINTDLSEIPEAKFGMLDNGWRTVSENFLSELKSNDLVGLAFEPISHVDDPAAPAGYEDSPFYAMQPSITLPRMSVEVPFMDKKGGAWSEASKGGGVIVQSKEYPCQAPGYSSEDLREVGDFDFALTVEPFGYDELPWRENRSIHVISQRFYRLIKGRSEGMVFTPVLIFDK